MAPEAFRIRVVADRDRRVRVDAHVAVRAALRHCLAGHLDGAAGKHRKPRALRRQRLELLMQQEILRRSVSCHPHIALDGEHVSALDLFCERNVPSAAMDCGEVAVLHAEGLCCLYGDIEDDRVV